MPSRATSAAVTFNKANSPYSVNLHIFHTHSSLHFFFFLRYTTHMMLGPAFSPFVTEFSHASHSIGKPTYNI